MFMALLTSLVVVFYCCVTADILTKLLQQCFLIFIVVPWLYLGNSLSQVSVYRTIGPTLVYRFCSVTFVALARFCSNFHHTLTIRHCMFYRKIGAEGSVLQELCHFVILNASCLP